MLRPTHGDRKFTANRTFAGREDERGVFDAAIQQTDTRELYKVLMWYGVGGQGKSTLLREFGRMARDFNEAEKKSRSGRGLTLAKVDFDDERLKRIDSALYSIRLQLGQASGLSFLTFDAAFVSYYRKTRPGIDVAAEFPELFRGENEAFADLLDVLGDNLSMAVDLASIALPGAGLIYKWGSRLTGRLKTWWSTRGNKVLAGIENLTSDELLQKLPSFLGIDICDGIAAKPSLRPVIFLDTYEALWRERGQKDAMTDRRADAWVRLLVQDSPGALFVIAGRDRLRWEEIDEAWGPVIEAHLLGDLSDEDAERFLKAVPIVEEDVRSRIVASSEGLPFHLDLQVTQYEEMREAGQELKPEAFGGTPSDILARFLEHLNDADQAQLRLASYVNVITRPIMADLAEAFPGRAVNFSFNRMVARSAFTQVSDGAYTIHALMQEELQRREREDNDPLFRQIHRYLFQHHNTWLLALSDDRMADSAIRKDAPIRFEAAFNHLMSGAPDEAVFWLLEYQGWLAGQEEWATIERLHMRALEYSERKNANKPANQLVVLNNIAAALENQGRSIEAKTYLERLLKISSQENEPDQIIVSVAQYNLGQIHRDRRDFSLAEACYSAAAKALERSADAVGANIGIVHCALGESLYLQGRYIEGLEHFRLAAKHAHQNGSTHDLSVAFHLLAEALQALRHYESAIPLFHMSQALLRPSGLTVIPSAVGGNQHDGSQGVSGMASQLYRSSLITRYKERQIFDASSVFSEVVRKDIEADDFYRDILGCTDSAIDYINGGSIEGINRASRKIYKFLGQSMEQYTQDILQSVTGYETGELLIRVARQVPKEFIVYEADFFDFQIDTVNGALWLVVPGKKRQGLSFHIVAFILWARYLDLAYSGEFNNSLKSKIEFAGHAHAMNFDMCLTLAKFVNGLSPNHKEEISEIISTVLNNILIGLDTGTSDEELYLLYAELCDGIGRVK